MKKPTAIITGASKGLGAELAKEFAGNGYNLGLLCKSDIQALENIAKKCIERNAEVYYSLCDVTSPLAASDYVLSFIEKFGRLDVLINNAAIGEYTKLIDHTESGFTEVLDTNLTGSFNFIRAAAKNMMKNRNGHIINIGSLSALEGIYGAPAYSASKCALAGLTQSSSAELGRFNIRVNIVIPGYLPTEMTGGMSERRVQALTQNTHLGRPNTFDEVCRFVLHLAAMRNVSGQVFNLDSRPHRWG